MIHRGAPLLKMYDHSVFRTEDFIRKYNAFDLQFYSFVYCVRDRSVSRNLLQIEINTKIYVFGLT